MTQNSSNDPKSIFCRENCDVASGQWKKSSRQFSPMGFCYKKMAMQILAKLSLKLRS